VQLQTTNGFSRSNAKAGFAASPFLVQLCNVIQTRESIEAGTLLRRVEPGLFREISTVYSYDFAGFLWEL
jgi:hypothetical protein